ncbi:hypothetical protein TNCV_500361 [Trichonephila clavipes]|nr:hypothetical protein TNCV_500361 [Trichonephila clavipes]
MILRKKYLGCASSFQPSIWFCDVRGVGSLVGRGGRDFGSGGPMGVKETSAMEVIFDWRLEHNRVGKRRLEGNYFGSYLIFSREWMFNILF